MRHPAVFLVLLFWLAANGAAFGEWPESSLALVSPMSATLSWDEHETPNPQEALLKALVPRLSRELGVPVHYEVKAEGEGVLAANAVAVAREDGYVLAALGNDPAVNLVIQGYTPYIRGEMAPVATAWRVVHVIVVRSDYPFEDIRGLAAGLKNKGRNISPPRLARPSGPLGSAVLMAMEAARQAGFNWELAVVDRPGPVVLLEGQAEALVMPLADFKVYPRRDEFKAFLVLSEEEPKGAEGWPNLKTQDLKLTIDSFCAFYLTAKVNWRVRSRLSTAINNTLRLKAVAERVVEVGLLPYMEDSEGVGAVLDQEYANQVKLLESFNYLETSGVREASPE
jgi:tripartite-type tricarboxylate transporter receptor subunit TctC